MDTATAETTTVVRPPVILANTFNLQNRRISVSYSATSFTGQPLFHYKDRVHEVNARGEEIRQVESEIGTLVSITLEPDADAGSLIFSVLIPRVALMSTVAEQPVEAVAIFTRSRLPPRLPANVQLQTHDTVELRGSATFVVA
ncbi:hypothetical protein [Hyalangium gracile]|uniref:hypothetical protein n=1 Tax=Hyalangium gracile TaxID=394092 RepID=UPI001CCA1346|nr:hypothetical protein [Hyalangium gracile]